MEQAERELIQLMINRDQRLRRLYEQHCRLEEQLSHYSKRPFLTSSEEMLEKRLKREKLQGVDSMMQIIAQRQSAA